MKTKKNLAIFRNMNIKYLKKMYRSSVSYVFNKNTWKSSSLDSYGKSKILLKTRKTIKKFGDDLKIFKFPTIEGLKIIYNKSMALAFDMNQSEHLLALTSEENYLLRDISSSSEYTNEKELKIFKLPTIEKLESSYYKSIGK